MVQHGQEFLALALSRFRTQVVQRHDTGHLFGARAGDKLVVRHAGPGGEFVDFSMHEGGQSVGQRGCGSVSCC